MACCVSGHVVESGESGVYCGESGGVAPASRGWPSDGERGVSPYASGSPASPGAAGPAVASAECC
eukprot:7074948-Prymnesium_polylepis.1